MLTKKQSIGEWVITEITDSDHLKFDASDSGLTSTTITGLTITMKVAPLGWAKVFYDESTSVAVYQSLDSFSRRNFLRVDDSDNAAYNVFGVTYFRGYEFMSSTLDQGNYAFPLRSVLSRGVHLRKCMQTSAGIYYPVNGTSISWVLVGTSKQFYFNSQVGLGDDPRTRGSVFFGDLTSYVPGDVGATGISGEHSTSSSYDAADSFTNINTYSYNFCPRSSKRTHTVSSQRFKVLPHLGWLSNLIGNTAYSDPDIYSMKQIVSRPLLVVDEGTATTVRGEMPGLAATIANLPSTTPRYEPGQILTFGGERFAYMAAYYYSSQYGAYLLTLDKDWNTPLL